MPEAAPNQPTVKDDDLLANAIPIDDLDLEEVDDEVPGLAADPSAAPAPPRPTSPTASIAPAVSPDASTKIRRFETPRASKQWARKPNVTGEGAVHCKTFVAKMREESLAHLDETVNEWLDAHPDVEVKFVTTTVGRLQGKGVEDALVVNLWL